MAKKLYLALVLIICFSSVFAQRERLDQITDSIKSEGYALYRSEWASWYGTDIFLYKCAAKKSLSGGYFSYETERALTNIFFSKGDNPMVLASITFAKDFNPGNYKLDTIPRKFDKIEQNYYALRAAARERMSSDTIFKYFNNTNLNIVPLIEKDIKRVYILTGPQVNGVVIFGNDYLVDFNDKNEITSIKKLHRNIISMKAKADTGSAITTTYHTHLPASGDFMSATDICTLLLYQKLTTWKQHYVVSKNYFSIWDCDKSQFLIMTREAMERINAGQKEKHPDKQ
ncbi:MAG TPA: hypothetical protein VIM55_06985 [Mucilaginibacter sp.]